jgi:bifunctional ADP-heptose synthase (sugar kinase/adenylyltransferase)
VTKRILVVGDIMLDHYTYVQTTRKAAEADIPVWDEVGDEYRFGGAANVAFNLACLSTQDVVELDVAGIASSDLCASLKTSGLASGGYLVRGAPMIKRRYVQKDSTKIIARFDSRLEFEKKDRWQFQGVSEQRRHRPYPEVARSVLRGFEEEGPLLVPWCQSHQAQRA